MSENYDFNPYSFYNPPSQQQQQQNEQQQISFSQSLPSFSPHFNFSFPPPFPLPTTPIQQTLHEEQRYSKQQRVCSSDNYTADYNVCQQPLQLHSEQERLQKLRLAEYFGASEDIEQSDQQLMYNGTPINKRKKQHNEHDTFESQPHYKIDKPFTTVNEVDNNVIIDSDLSSVSSYVTAPEEPIMDDDNDLKHKRYYKELIKKYGRSPGKAYVNKPSVESYIDLPCQSGQLFNDQVNREAVVAIVEHFSLAQTLIIRDRNNYIMRTQGSVEQEELSKLMMHAIVSMGVGLYLCDNVYGTRFYVTLKLKGKRFRGRAKELYETMAKIVPSPDRLVRTHDLHVTVARFPITNDVDLKKLLKIVTDTGNGLRQAVTHDPLIGYLNTATVDEGFIGANTRNNLNNNIGIIREKIRRDLKDNGFHDEGYPGQK
ncbi:hypothetical protein INT45_012949 [Circinella minor]|uniref:Uncharacterized protein n=1 Tax=Circinella minor TaxID=1195481 RepID=A0A8H7S5C8_9FUNG|nr:hypothetical protein INT45_012949 [Circinella minor]